ncbi:exocyst complex component EXO70A1-like [Cornus florida]|uniref:exocyst complex component EXO70A1-like n=1 Tax=Cornus florida TaxID=4283 RepID=UPI0028986840|nr:exocyst complex component EXO70A1-like [Cornus florida]
MELPENYSREFESAVERIRDSIFECDHDQIDQYLQAVDEIQRSMGFMKDDNLSRANKMMQIAVARLKEEFRNILISNVCSIETDSLSYPPDYLAYSTSLSTEYIKDDPPLSKESISGLRSISERMSYAGYIGDCIQVYVDVRKSFMDTNFQRLGLEKLGTGKIKRLDWEILAAKIVRWIQAAQVCVQFLFAREKQLCKQIFEGLGSGGEDDECFTRTVKDHAIVFLNFAESVAVIRPSPEKLFKVLDLYNELSQLLPEIRDVIFRSESFLQIRVQATETVSGLAEAARGILTKFENDVLRELSEIPVPGGSTHPLTKYVMHYIIRMISDYKQNLIELVIPMPSPSLTCSGDMDLVKLAGQTPLAFRLSWIIVVLQFKLDGKSKHYEDESLGHLFMMNNIHHIVQKINDFTELQEMVGNSFVEKLAEKVQHAMEDYQISTWNKILFPLDLVAPNADWRFLFGRDTSMVALKSFYAMFERAHETQAEWLVPDLRLREAIRRSILNRLIPSYKLMLDKMDVSKNNKLIRHRMDAMHRENLQKYIKFSVEDIESAISDFFKGHSVWDQLTEIHQIH